MPEFVDTEETGNEYFDPSLSRAGYAEPPIPYIEEPAEGEVWSKDYHDNALPTQRGFITDFVYYTRGFETPTLSCIWTALFILSSAIKREAWLKWEPHGLYSNQYIIIIGPAGLVKKTTAVSVVGLPILRKFRYYLSHDKNLYAMKSVTIIKDKSTPEAVLSAMIPENKDGHDRWLVDENGDPLIGPDGKQVRYKRTSEACIVVSELSTLLSKASYAETMIPILLDLYDNHPDWEWRREGRGTKVLKNLHTTLLGGTTVEGLRSSIPESASGDGFLSRLVPIYVPDTKREYDEPFIPKNGPSEDELAKRLAWIAEHVIGQYEFTNEAKAYFKVWYHSLKEYQRENPGIAPSISRLDINVRKTALLIRAQRYDEGPPYITLEDLKTAIRLMDITYKSFSFLRSQISPDELEYWTARIEEYIKKRKIVDRVKILKSLHVKAEMATIAIEELISRGRVLAKYDGNEIPHATGRNTEVYEYLGDGNDGIGEAEYFRDGQNPFNPPEVPNAQANSEGAWGKSRSAKRLPKSASTNRPGRGTQNSRRKKAPQGKEPQEAVAPSAMAGEPP